MLNPIRRSSAFSRRSFCAAAAGLSAARLCGASATVGGARLQVIAYNVFGGRGWPHQRARAKQMVASGGFAQALQKALAPYDADIICLSESPGAKVTKELAERLKMNHVRFPSAGQWPGTLLSRHAIIESRNTPTNGGRPRDLFTRHWGKAVIEWPPAKQLVVHSVHLFPTPDPAVRLREIDTIISACRPDIVAGRSLLVMGDFNHGPESTEYKRWQSAGFVDAWAKAGRGTGATFRSDIPKWRIDYVLAHGPISQHIVEARCPSKPPFRLDLKDPQAFALSDHLPVYAAFDTRKP